MMKIGFKAETLYESKLKHNARKVEAKLQNMYHHLPYGRRLWKQPDMGAKYNQKFEEKQMYYVGIIYHPDLESLVEKEIVIVNHGNVDITQDGHGIQNIVTCFEFYSTYNGVL